MFQVSWKGAATPNGNFLGCMTPREGPPGLPRQRPAAPFKVQPKNDLPGIGQGA